METSIDKAAVCLAAALEPDPFYRTMTVDFAPHLPDRRATLAAYFAYSVEEGRRLGVSTIPDDAFGAAVWIKPQDAALVREAKAAKYAFLEQTLGRRSFDNYRRMIDFMAPRETPVVNPSAWYLSILGVCPDLQGKGRGAALVNPVLALADQAGATCYVETFNARTLSFYQRLGFQIAAAHDEPITAERYWILVRAPAGSTS